MQTNCLSETFHQGVVFFSLACLLRKLHQPFTECVVQSAFLCASELPSLLNQLFISTQSDIFHTKIVYTVFVYTASLLSC